MFKSIELGQAISKKASDDQEVGLCAQLLELQRDLRDTNVAT